MSQINYSFLQSGLMWDQSEIQNLEFNFANNTPLYLYTQIGFLNEFANLGNSFSFSASASPADFDQQDAVRFFLLSASELDNFTNSSTINSVLVNSSAYRVSFSDILSTNFSEDVDGEIQLVNHEGESDQSLSLGFFPGTTSAAGDIVINYLGSGYDDLAPGQAGFWLIVHEMGHAIGGLEHSDGTQYDSQQYTIMSYNPHISVYASGLQLLDIAAIQDTYGQRNYDTRDENTEYALGQGLGFAGASENDAFLYTIWDGGGTADEIDASDFTDGVKIDLRQGEFSSIGVNGLGGDALDNVAVAYYTVIENAVGTDDNVGAGDTIIGNAWNNRLEGGAGADQIYGDGVVYDGDAGFGAAASEDDPYRSYGTRDGIHGAAANGSGDDVLIGGAGADRIDGGLGNDTVDYSTDAAAGGLQRVRVNLDANGNGTATDGFGDTDTLLGIEYVTGTTLNDEFRLQGADDRRIAGSGGVDTLIYRSAHTGHSSTGVQVMLDGVGNGSVSDGRGGTDQFTSMEKITGTSLDDSFFIQAAGGYTIDGRYGTDRVSYGSGAVFDQNTDLVWDGNGRTRDTLLNIDHVFTEKVLADTAGDHGIDMGYYDYAAYRGDIDVTLNFEVNARQLSNGFWQIQGFADLSVNLSNGAEHNAGDVTALGLDLDLFGAVSEVYENSGAHGLFSNLTGSNNGDHVVITGEGSGIISHGFTFYSGSGDDIVDMRTDTNANGYVNNVDLTYTYNGGPRDFCGGERVSAHRPKFTRPKPQGSHYKQWPQAVNDNHCIHLNRFMRGSACSHDYTYICVSNDNPVRGTGRRLAHAV